MATTVYVNRQVLPKDFLSSKHLPGYDMATVAAKQTLSLTTGSSAVASTAGAAVDQQEVFVVRPLANAIWVKFGTGTPTAAVGSDHYVAAGEIRRFIVPKGYKLAAFEHA